MKNVGIERTSSSERRALAERFDDSSAINSWDRVHELAHWGVWNRDVGGSHPTAPTSRRTRQGANALRATLRALPRAFARARASLASPARAFTGAKTRAGNRARRRPRARIIAFDDECARPRVARLDAFARLNPRGDARASSAGSRRRARARPAALGTVASPSSRSFTHLGRFL